MILVVLAVVTFIYLGDIKNPPASGPDGLAQGVQVASIDQSAPPRDGGRTLTIGVNGQQYLWRYEYPGGDAFSYFEMVVPTNTTVVLKITSSDVIHSWWIPKLGGKADATPGYIERDLVQDLQGGRLQGPVRRAVRLRPRRHARPGAGRVARALHGLRPPPAGAAQGGPAGPRRRSAARGRSG